MPVDQMWAVEGQLGDEALVSVGRGSVYTGGRNGDDLVSAAMLSPDAARRYADAIREAADECDRLTR